MLGIPHLLPPGPSIIGLDSEYTRALFAGIIHRLLQLLFGFGGVATVM